MNLPIDFFTRGIERIYPNVEAFKTRLATGEKLKIYFGIDPTGPTLHLGHATVLLKLKELQDAGHEVIVLFGDFTAQIGDPSGKLSARVALSVEAVNNNLKKYKKQIGKILNLKKTIFKKNAVWLGKLKLGEILNLASEFTVSQMLERDMFAERQKAGQPIFLNEFFYPLLQGYDSVAMSVDAEIGANDQTFNMLTGRTMMSKRGKEKFVIATKLLVDASGKKMGKTEGNMVTFEDAPNEVYGQVMSWSDEMLALGFEICTRLKEEEIKNLIAGNPRDAKMRLAKEVTKLFHGESKANKAEKNFVKVFQTKELPNEIQEVKAGKGSLLADILIKEKLVDSKTAFKNLIEGGAITINGETKITDQWFKVETTNIFRVGKKKFLKVLV
ncbi:MAG: tyrosine--tRNA ligase [Patescibacteria group bacterium]